jgi:hypothetical protein
LGAVVTAPPDPRPSLCGCAESRALRALLTEAADILDEDLINALAAGNRRHANDLTDLLARIRALEAK